MDTNNNIDLKKFKNINDFFSHQKDLFYNKIKNLDHDKIDNIKNIDEIYTDINYKENSEPSNNIYSDYINSSKSKNASVTPKITKTNVEIDDIFEIGTDSDERTEKLKRLYSASGVVYRFNRGITVIGKNGLKVEEVFDGTTMHHATSLVDICKECFGVEIPFNGISSDMESGIEAGNNGLISMLYEGNNCMIFIPEDLTISEIDEMIEEIEPRDKFIFSVVRSMDKYRIEITQDELLSYLRGLRATKKKEATKETPQEKNKISINEYINLVLRFIDEKNISLLDYYRNVGRQYRVREEDRLPEFEKRNPFVDEGDIKLLVEKEDDKIVEYFARAIDRVITSNLGGKLNEKSKEEKPKEPTKDDTELTEMLDNEQVSQNEVITEDISFDTLDDYNGYVVVRDDKNINIYTYDSIDNTKLKNRVTYPSEKFNLKSGYYINLKDFLNEIRTKYHDSIVSFITESGTELDYNSVTKSLTDYCLEEGGIRLSNGKGEYLDDIFINRRDLKSFLSKFKVKYTIKKENNNQSVK